MASRIKVGLLGAGDIAGMHAQAIHKLPTAELVCHELHLISIKLASQFSVQQSCYALAYICVSIRQLYRIIRRGWCGAPASLFALEDNGLYASTRFTIYSRYRDYTSVMYLPLRQAGIWSREGCPIVPDVAARATELDAK
jgi:hypothetical protein